jgi:esterase/lipase
MEQQFTRFMNTGGITTLHCIGHSLGGALATLVANKYSQCSHLKVNLYTFGSPRVFYGLGDKLTNVNSYRVFNMSDPVPMLGPFPLMHYDGGIGVGSSMQVCNPFAHFMESYLGICHRDVAWSSLQAPVHTPHGFVEKSKDFLSAGGAWMFRAFQHLVTYAVSVLGLGLGTAGAAIYATYTAVDVIFELLQKGMSKLSTWIVGLLRGMSRFVKNGWESAKASSNDSYYKSKTVILYIVEQFLMKLKQLAMSALNQAKPMIGSGVTAVKALKSARLPLPTMFL